MIKLGQLYENEEILYDVYKDEQRNSIPGFHPWIGLLPLSTLSLSCRFCGYEWEQESATESTRACTYHWGPQVFQLKIQSHVITTTTDIRTKQHLRFLHVPTSLTKLYLSNHKQLTVNHNCQKREEEKHTKNGL